MDHCARALKSPSALSACQPGIPQARKPERHNTASALMRRGTGEPGQRLTRGRVRAGGLGCRGISMEGGVGRFAQGNVSPKAGLGWEA